jgi:hypothetical protein
VARDLAAYAAKRWVEHVVIGAPFGMLGMDAAGNVSWLQLETREALKTLAELAEIEGVPPDGLADIRDGRKLANLELRQALSMTEPCELLPAFPVGEGGPLLGALFPVPSAYSPDPENSYSRWLARQERRQVQH